ncbi:collagen alpha-1(I) chain-like isoform X2 [Moschus berezovskii]|uniref:collagen alpha-1(I) chain-like isoform X2 n=1 Tax=Moschus berezovskii TaxID=68408 RepID=UPI002444EBB8|nr:collagen alpha-1(I) chain-like isoform X2 [Moschus berezovskii]XP_055290186.1 collagen alpha-1(I) chain-like isoform X2 [Moschus berezovskii]
MAAPAAGPSGPRKMTSWGVGAASPALGLAGGRGREARPPPRVTRARGPARGCAGRKSSPSRGGRGAARAPAAPPALPQLLGTRGELVPPEPSPWRPRGRGPCAAARPACALLASLREHPRARAQLSFQALGAPSERESALLVHTILF